MKKLLIVGLGNMGFAIASGITKKKVYSKESIVCIEKKYSRTSFLKKKKYVVSRDPVSAIKKHSAKKIKAIILAVKPNDVTTVLTNIKPYLPKSTLIISILAGIKLQRLSSLLPGKIPIARVMPNTPAQIGEGMSVITFNKHVNNKQKLIVKNIFKAIGDIVELKEKQFDLVTALSGSGPAYFCYLIECLTQSAVKLGLSEKVALRLLLQTAFGTSILLTKANIQPSILRKQVTSPKGTTEAAIKVFKKKKLKDIIHLAIKAAKERSEELGKV